MSHNELLSIGPAKTTRWLFLFLLASTLFSPATAQLIPQTRHQQWFTLSTTYFDIHFPAGNRATAEELASFCDEVYLTVTRAYQRPLRRKMNVVIVDAGDMANGFAIANLDFVSIEPTEMYLDSFNLRGRSRWLRNVFTHEFTHIVSLKEATSLGERVFAFSPLAYLPFEKEKTEAIVALPVVGRISPYWWSEGVAQLSAQRSGYDAFDTHRAMLLRTAALEGNLLSAAEMSTQPALKGSFLGELAYNQGFSLALYLAKHFGEDANPAIAKRQGRDWNFSFPESFDPGRFPPFEELYGSWREEIERESLAELQRLTPELARGKQVVLTPDQDLSDDLVDPRAVKTWTPDQLLEQRAKPLYQIKPQPSPNGRYLAFLKGSTLTVALREQPATGAASWWQASVKTGANAQVKSFAWSPDSRSIAIVAGFKDSPSTLEGYDFTDLGLLDLGPFIDTVDQRLNDYRKVASAWPPLDASTDAQERERRWEVARDVLGKNFSEIIPTSANTFYASEFLGTRPMVGIRLSNGERLVDLDWSPDGKTLALVQNVHGRLRKLVLFDLHNYLRRTLQYTVVRYLHRSFKPEKFKQAKWKEVKGLANAQHLITQVRTLELDPIERNFDLFFLRYTHPFGKVSGNGALATLFSELSAGDFSHLGDPDHLEALSSLLELRTFKPRTSLFRDHLSELVALPETVQCHAPRFSPDGRSLVYYRYLDGRQNIMLQPLEGTPPTVLTSDRFENRDPVFSPEGDAVYYVSDRSGIFNVYRRSLEDGTVTQVTNVIGGAFFPHPHADGLFFTSFSSFGFRSYRLENSAFLGRSVEPIAEPTPEPLSPDVPPSPEPPPTSVRHTIKPYSLTLVPLQLIPEVNLFDEQYGAGINVLLMDYLNRHDLVLRAYLDRDQVFSVSYAYHHWLGDLFAELQTIRTNFQVENYLTEAGVKQLGLDTNPGLYGKRYQDNLTVGTNFSILGGHYELSTHYRDITAETSTVLFAGPDLHDSEFQFGLDPNRDYGDLPEFKVITNLGVTWQFEYGTMSRRRDGDIDPEGYLLSLGLTHTWSDIDERFSALGMFGGFEAGDPQTDYDFNTLDIRLTQDFRLTDFGLRGMLAAHSLGYQLHLTSLDRDVRMFDELYLGGKQIFRTFRDVNNTVTFPGYDSFSLIGERRFLFNLHYRLPIYRDLARQYAFLHLDDLYLELFADAGNAWDYGTATYFTVADGKGGLERSPSVLFDTGLNLEAKNFVFYNWPLHAFVTIAHGFQDREVSLLQKGAYDGLPLRFYVGLGAGL